MGLSTKAGEVKPPRVDSLHSDQAAGRPPAPSAQARALTSVPELFRTAVQNYAELFVNRWDIYGQQTDDGSYICVRRPLTYDLLWRHLRGQVTLGAYSMDEENETHWLVFDADQGADWTKLIQLSAALDERGIASYLERSRRGGHLWFFFQEHLPGQTVRAFGQQLLSWAEAQPEMFPKTGENKGGPGTLIRLPLGIHRRTGKRYPFVDRQGKPLGANVGDQLQALLDVQRVSTLCVANALGQALSSRWKRPVRSETQSVTGVSSDLIEHLKKRDLFEFVGQYVELAPNGKGHCPFHDDRHMSFSVNREGNYWNCFAGCGGGDIIHFWEKWRRIPRSDAIKELANMMPR